MAYVTFNKNLEKANIISIGDNHSAVDGKLYFAKDDPSIYLGKEDGTVELKASATEIANGFVDDQNMALSAASGKNLDDRVTELNNTKTNKPAGGAMGSATQPVYIDANGNFQECNEYSSSYSITFNGVTIAPSDPLSFYAPTDSGSAGNYLRSNGNGAPEWTAFPTIPSISLNGTSTTNASFYAPTNVQSATGKCPVWNGSGWEWATPGGGGTGGTSVYHEGRSSVDTALYINSGSSSVETDEYVIYAPKTKASSAGQVLVWPNGSSNVPVWQTLPAGIQATLNGTAQTSDYSFWAPTNSTANDNGKILMSNGTSAPSWTDKTTVTLNGTQTTTPSFYAPTSLGTAGQVLTTNANEDGVQWADVQSGNVMPARVVQLSDWTTTPTTSSYTIDPGKFYIFNSLPFSQSVVIQLDADDDKLADNAVNEYSFSIPSNSTNLMFSVINSSVTITWCSGISPSSDAEYSVYIYKINGVVLPTARGVFRTWQ